jgi:hypothetical protein
MFNFINGERDATDGSYERFQAYEPDRSAGSCVFWEGPGIGWDYPWERNHVRQQLQADPRHACEDYPAAWDPEHHRSLCHLCY